MKQIKLFSVIFFVLVSIIFASNKKYFVSNIEFDGNTSFAKIELLDIIRLQAPGLLSKTYFTPKLLNLDEITLEAFYRANGFIDIFVESKVIKTVGNLVDIKFTIIEGNRYYLKSFEIVGNKIVSDVKISEFIQVKNGSTFNPVQISHDLKKIKYHYKTIGKKNISLIDEIKIVDQNIHLRITISEGKTFNIKSIDIKGSTSVKKKYIEREILFSIDEPFNVKLIDETKTNIFEIGLFSYVEILTKSDTLNESNIEITIQVRELKSRGIYAEFGFDQVSSTVDGNLPVSIVNSSVDWQAGNVFKSPTKLGFGTEFGIKVNEIKNFKLFRKYAYIKIKSPWVWKFKAPITNKFYVEDLDDETQVISYGLISTISYRIRKTSQLNLNFNLNFISTEEDNIIENRNIKLTYLNQNIINPIFPISGHALTTSSTFHGNILGGNRHFVQLDFEYRKYHTLLDPLVLAFKVKYNYILTLPDNSGEFDETLSYYDLFHLGGESTLRGWNSISDFYSQDSTLDEEGSKIRFLSNVELRFPIFWKIGGELFYDGGFLSNDTLVDNNLYWDIGYGFTFSTPLGPARFDFAYPFADKKQGNFTLSMAYMF